MKKSRVQLVIAAYILCLVNGLPLSHDLIYQDGEPTVIPSRNITNAEEKTLQETNATLEALAGSRYRRQNKQHPCEDTEKKMSVNGKSLRIVTCLASSNTACSDRIPIFGAALCEPIKSKVLLPDNVTWYTYVSTCTCKRIPPD